MTVERIQLRRRKGWVMPNNTVKVDRTTPWGNPFVVGQHGTREECVDLFCKMLAGLICLTEGPKPEAQLDYLKHVKAHLAELRGRNLACWCPPGTPCHADVLLEIANAKGAA